MTHPESWAKYFALTLAALVASSCDTRLPTQTSSTSTGSTTDAERPVVTYTLDGGLNSAVPFGLPIGLSVKVTDNVGVATIQTSVRNGAQIIALDTVTLKPTSAITTRTITIPLAGLKKTDKLVVRTTATDAASNTRVDSLTISFAAPTITLLSPLPSAKLNVGDSLLVSARIQDAAGIKSVTFLGYTLRGNPDLGTQQTLARYPAVTAPSSGGTFAAGVTDTIIRRYLKVAVPVDTVADSLVVSAIALDNLGGIDTARVSVKIVRGPSVQVLSPVAGDSATPGAGLTITLRATDLTGVAKLGFRLQSDPTFPTKVDTTVTATYPALPKDVTFSATIQIPANAPPKALLTITPTSTNSGGQDGASAPVTIAVRAGLPPAPRVYQVISKRVETVDSLTVTAIGNGVTIVGYVLRDLAGAVIKRDSVILATPFPSTSVQTIALNLPASARGKQLTLTSFAYDQSGRVGYSIPAGTTAPQGIAANAFTDSALVVFGTTYPLPVGRNGTIADLQVDATRGNVFLSNINYGRLEVWTKAVKDFDATGIVVGSQPWGMAFSRTAPGKDSMYVANSGGTNLSRVYIGGAPSTMKEDLVNRLVTRASYLFKLTEGIDPATNKIRLTTSPPILFSDRPQYVEESKGGRLYFSTKPTIQASQGTIRYMDPAATAPDERFILDFAFLGSDPNSYVLANLDGVTVTPAPATSTLNDLLELCDHASGTLNPPTCVSGRGGIKATIDLLLAAVPTSDVDYKVNIDFNSLGLTDTTYSGASGDGRWITFGEGNKGPVARNFALLDDGAGRVRQNGVLDLDTYTYASPSLNIADLLTNASDQVFGVALDKTGKTIGIHGTETAFSAVSIPFTQRLQGKKSTFAKGAGIAFHPNADGTSTPEASRLAFVASDNGTIEAVDIAFYDFVRGSLATKFNLYGPLRATLPFPGDPPSVVFKLFGVSAKGLVVVDVTAADILPGP
ncbi:MAG: hypothetical protein M3Z05_16655 [Gemmatimonadota bacterium]|nr:hypothetical protein [Gemmatimonadota bacterium]